MCSAPRTMWRVDRQWTFREPLVPSLYQSQQISCGQCAPCRLAKSADWQARLTVEGRTVPNSICATFTYAPEHLPPLMSLHYPHMVECVRHLRRRGFKFSYDILGEYSPELMRPHYHGAFFGFVPPDAKPWAKSQAGNQEYVSEILSKAWPHGFVTFQHWSAGAASYIAGHQAWKLTGGASEARRQVFDNGVLIGTRDPEFHRVSTRPGIGRRYFERYGRDAIRFGDVVADPSKGPMPLPKYFVRLAKQLHPEAAVGLVEKRTLIAQERAARADEGPSVEARDVCAMERIKRGSRSKGMR